jgi:hypothetical protein
MVSPYIRKKNFEVYHKFETSIKPEQVWIHPKGSSCYNNMRFEIINSIYPGLTIDQVEQFAAMTSGYSKDEIAKIIREFISGDFSRKQFYQYGQCPLDPDSGGWSECLILV